MNAAQMPGMGDEITWGPVMHPNDPRQPEPSDEGDITSETLELVREWLDDAENAHDAGNDEKARQCLREVIAALEEFAGEVTA